MNVGLYQAAAVMNASNRWQEVIADNMSAAHVPGFKKQDLSFSAVQAGLLANADGTRLGPDGRISMPAAGVSTNFQQGELQPGGDLLDVAISGPGFFEVQLPDGTTAFTRDGQFTLDAQGQMVTRQGYPLLSDAGPLQVDPMRRREIGISPEGEVSQGADSSGRLKLTEFNDPALLTPLGSGLYAAQDPNLVPIPAAETSVRQSFLEASNTSSALEMASLISAMRMHEAGQRMIHTQDELLGKAVSELGSPN